jgi:hypothetical protein
MLIEDQLCVSDVLNMVLNFYLLIVVLGGGILRHFQKFLPYIKYIVLELIPSTILLHSPFPSIPGTVSTDIIFPLTYVYTRYLQQIHLLLIRSQTSLSSLAK